MRFQTFRKTSIVVGMSLALICFVLGFVFEHKFLDITVFALFLACPVILAINLAVISFKSLESERSIKWLDPGMSLKNLLALGYLCFLAVMCITFSIVAESIYESTILVETAYDFYFCSSENIDYRIAKWQGTVEKLFGIIDEHIVDEPEKAKTVILAQLGQTYSTEPSDDRINHLRLARWFYQKGRETSFKTYGPCTNNYFDSQIAAIDAELGAESARVAKLETREQK